MTRQLVTTIAIIAVLVPATGALADWQGTVTTEGSVKTVRNPDKPMATTEVAMEEIWRRGGEDDDMIFGLPGQIVQDDAGNLYVLDTQVSEILVFSPDGDYLRTIGREGDGPGEFRNANDLYMGPDGNLGVVVVFPGKVIRLTPDGLPLDNLPLPTVEGGGFQLVFKGIGTKDRVVICGGKQSRSDQAREQLNYLKAFDSKGNVIADYHEMTEATQYGNMKYDEKVFANFKGYWTVAADGRVAGVLEFDPYRIHVWNPDGSLSHVIERPAYTPLTRSGEQKKRFQALWDGITSWNPNSTFQISDTHRAIIRLNYRPDGSLWVLSGRGVWERGDGVFAVFDEYDKDGRFTRQVVLKGEGDPQDDAIYFVGNRMYRVIDSFSAVLAQFGGTEDAADEEISPEALSLVAYEIDVPEMGMR